MEAEVTIVIVTYNSQHVVGDLLDSLAAASEGCRTQVVVVDNGSSDETTAVVEQRGVHLVRSTNRGYAAGINTGVAEASSSEAILVLNPDVVLGEGVIATLLATMRETGAGVVAPMVFDVDGAIFRSLRREPTLKRALGLGSTGRPGLSEYVVESAAYRTAHEVDWALGAALLVDRRCHDALGGWDETFFLYSEETDLSLRARDLGWPTWYEPAASVRHIGGASGQSGSTHAMQIVNRVRLYTRRHGRVGGAAYQALSILSELSWLVRGESKTRASIRALLVPSARPAQLRCQPGWLIR